MEEIKHLERWITASLITALSKRSSGKKVYLEGMDRLTNKEKEFIELRIDGPYLDPCGSKGEYYAYMEVNLLCTSSRNEANAFAATNLRGVMLHMLNTDICVYRTGNVGKETIDDESLVGTMKLLSVDKIKASNFGQIDPATQAYQAVAEAHYEMYFKLRS